MSTSKGFTLLELLLALAIFALLAAMAYGGLSTLLDTQSAAQREAERLAAVQLAFLHLERDTGQYLARGIRDAFGDSRPGLSGEVTSVEFTRAGWDNPLQQPRSTLQRVRYEWREGTLYRIYWRVLDRARDSGEIRVPLLTRVENLHLRYLDKTREWHDRWPPLNRDEMGGPRALQVNLEMPGWGRLVRLLELP